MSRYPWKEQMRGLGGLSWQLWCHTDQRKDADSMRMGYGQSDHHTLWSEMWVILGSSAWSPASRNAFMTKCRNLRGRDRGTQMECDDKLERNLAVGGSLNSSGCCSEFLLTASRRHRIENRPGYGPTYAAKIILRLFMWINLNKHRA